VAPLILNLGPRCDRHQAPGRLNPGENPWYTLHGRLPGPHSQSEPFTEENTLFALSGFEPRTLQQVAQSLYQIRNACLLMITWFSQESSEEQ
jgi:hypothetical protein